MIYTYTVIKVRMWNDLSNHAKAMLNMWKASHDEPHGIVFRQ